MVSALLAILVELKTLNRLKAIEVCRSYRRVDQNMKKYAENIAIGKPGDNK